MRLTGFIVAAATALISGIAAPALADEAQLTAKKLSRECIVELEVASCTSLGGALERGEGIEQNYEAAAELYTMTCENGDPAACGYLAALTADGRGVPKDLARAAVLFQKACDAGASGACERLSGLSKP